MGLSADIWCWVDFLREESLALPALSHVPAAEREGGAFSCILRHIPIALGSSPLFAGGFDVSRPEAAIGERFRAWLSERSGAASPGGGGRTSWGLLHEFFHCRPSDGGSAHTTVDYGRVVCRGVSGILADIDAASNGASGDRRAYLSGMRVALEGFVAFAERFAELAESAVVSAPAEADRAGLMALAKRCRHVPRHPARSFHEALQSIWFVHLCIALSERSGSSLSLGRLDQYLFPFFERDRADGVSIERLADLLAEFFRLLNSFGDPACTINLGPAVAGGASLSGGGDSCFNSLSRLILQVVKAQRLPSPILAARIHPDIPREAFDILTDPDLVTMGQPTFYGELSCMRALLRRGIPENEAHLWAANSCMGLMMPGQEWSNMWGSVANVLLPLELALNGGRPFHHACPLAFRTRIPQEYGTFDSLFETVCAFLDELLEKLIVETAERTARRGRACPNPFVSALLDDCIVRGRDRLVGGCRYHTVIVEAFGLVNAADALTAVRRLVFEEGRFSLAEMVAAAKVDFAENSELLRAVRSVPKYGAGEPAADLSARQLARRFAASVSRHSTEQIAYSPSFHTLSAHIPAGAAMGASLDGRRAGEPLAKNIGTSPGRVPGGHTGLIRSATAIEQEAFFGGQALDLWVDPRSLASRDGRGAFQALLQTYFRLGGLQIQVNGVSPETLRRAMAEPESHGHVLVRKAGFTTRFVTLPRTEQAELVERFEDGL